MRKSLSDQARDIVGDGDAWTVDGIVSILVDRQRDAGRKITSRVRDDCDDAARIAIAEWTLEKGQRR